MPVFFKGAPGRAVMLLDPAVQGNHRLVAPSPDIDFQGQTSIITRVAVRQRANVQFLHTLGSVVYVYVFGDRIGDLALSGLSFNGPCPGGGRHGIAQMFEWYDDNRVSATGSSIVVAVGGYTFTGFVVGVDGELADPATGLGQWTLNINTLPRT